MNIARPALHSLAQQQIDKANYRRFARGGFRTDIGNGGIIKK